MFSGGTRSNTLLEPQYSTQLPGVVRCYLIWLGCEEFGKVYGFEAFENFQCPDSIHPLVFTQTCSFYHQDKLPNQTLSSNSILANSSPLDVTTLVISSEAKKRP